MLRVLTSSGRPVADEASQRADEADPLEDHVSSGIALPQPPQPFAGLRQPPLALGVVDGAARPVWPTGRPAAAPGARTRHGDATAGWGAVRLPSVRGARQTEWLKT